MDKGEVRIYLKCTCLYLKYFHSTILHSAEYLKSLISSHLYCLHSGSSQEHPQKSAMAMWQMVSSRKHSQRQHRQDYTILWGAHTTSSPSSIPSATSLSSQISAPWNQHHRGCSFRDTLFHKHWANTSRVLSMGQRLTSPGPEQNSQVFTTFFFLPSA